MTQKCDIQYFLVVCEAAPVTIQGYSNKTLMNAHLIKFFNLINSYKLFNLCITVIWKMIESKCKEQTFKLRSQTE